MERLRNVSGGSQGVDVGLPDVKVISRTVIGLPDRLADEQTHGFSVVLRRKTLRLITASAKRLEANTLVNHEDTYGFVNGESVVDSRR